MRARRAKPNSVWSKYQQMLALAQSPKVGDAGGDNGGEADVGDDPAARDQWFLTSRSNPEGQTLRGVVAKASRRRHELTKRQSDPDGTGGTPGGPGSVNWTPIGPSVVSAGSLQDSGRLTSMAIGPGGNRVYLGSANGGVWYLAGRGSDVDPARRLHRVADAVRGRDRGGLAFRRCHRRELRIERLDRRGLHRHRRGEQQLRRVPRHRHPPLAHGRVDPRGDEPRRHGDLRHRHRPERYDADQRLRGNQTGLYKRPIGGPYTNWNQVTSSIFTNPTGRVSSFVSASSGAGRMFYAAFYNDNVYSFDGTTWTALTGIPAGSQRISLAASESSPGTVYAFCSTGAIYRLSGTAFSPITGLPPSVIFSDNGVGQGWYDIAIAVNPTNSNTIIVGGDAWAVFKGTISGSVFPFNAANTTQPWVDPTWVGANVHSDVHSNRLRHEHGRYGARPH